MLFDIFGANLEDPKLLRFAIVAPSYRECRCPPGPKCRKSLKKVVPGLSARCQKSAEKVENVTKKSLFASGVFRIP